MLERGRLDRPSYPHDSSVGIPKNKKYHRYHPGVDCTLGFQGVDPTHQP